MSGYRDPYIRRHDYYHEHGGRGSRSSSHRSPDYAFDQDHYDREYRDVDSHDSYGSNSRYRGRSSSRSRSRSRSRSPYERRRSTHHRSRERSYSRERKYRDQDNDRYSRDRDRFYDERREDRRRHSNEDDRSSHGSYDSGKSRHDSDYGGSSDHRYREHRHNRGRDEWLDHVWGGGSRLDRTSSNIDVDLYSENYDRNSYKMQVPNKTLILHGLGYYITEKDIKDEIIRDGGRPREIRLIRKKDSGSSRGFAFVEFYSTEDARMMVERHDGEFQLHDQKVVMQYSIQRDFEKVPPSSDWYCRCYALNFKRREFCYRCGSDRKSGECPADLDESSLHPTHTVMLKGLHQSTIEANVLKGIQTLSSLPIRSVRIGRDKNNVSRGVCYLEMNNTADAMYLHNTLLVERPRIDGRLVYVSYCKNAAVSTAVTSATASNAGNAAIAAAQWSNQKNEAQSTQEHDIPRLAEYSASLYAKNPTEHEAFVKHYLEYYTNLLREGGTLPSIDSVCSAGTVSTDCRQSSENGTATATTSSAVVAPATNFAPRGEPPDGSGHQKYPVPDVSAYQFDKTSGYYYDSFTTLYYDANSQYYFNSKTKKFLYWDGTRNTYLLAPSSGDGDTKYQANPAHAATVSEREEEEKKKKETPEDKDKVKVAKRVAKDMEKWAKTLNHKKEVAKHNLVASQVQPVLKAQGAVDIGYTVGVLGKKESNGSMTTNPYLNHQALTDSLVAEYGHGSESEEEQENGALQQDDRHVDWTKMACLLCKRGFPNKETLLKHQQLSDLHKQNLEAWYTSMGISKEDAKQRSVQYRDRAKERRIKCNEPERAPSNRLKENYMKAREAPVNYEQPTKKRIGGDNVGNKLLQKMGWQEGMGLGKSNQGRTDIIQADGRLMSAGLGTRIQGVVPGPGETYKDCVKKMMRARYEEVNDR